MARKTAAKKTTGRKAGPRKPRAAAPGNASDAGPAAGLPPHPPPRPLDAIIGQDRALATLRAAMGSGRVHHCWLFSGPPGVGKFTAALSFAAALLDPGGSSRAGRLLAAGAHPDLRIIRKELAAFSAEPSVRAGKQTTIPIAVVKEFLIRPSQLAPTITPGHLAEKVFIVDEAELLGSSQREAQNALLKTLEEPPEGTVIILVTASEDRLLPTIRSRAQRVVFTTLADDDLRRWAAEADAGLSGRDLDEAIELAGGSPGRLETIARTDQLGLYRSLRAGLERAATRGELDPNLGPAMAKWADAAAKTWADADAARSKDMANRAAAADVFRLIAAHGRGLLGRSGAALIGAGFIDAVTRAEQRLGSNVMLSMVMEGLAADLAEAGRLDA